MTAILLPSIFTLVVDGKSTLVFHAKNLREAHELCREQWMKEDLRRATSEGLPLLTASGRLQARIAREDEAQVYLDAANHAKPSDGLLLVYLVPLDGEAR